MEREIRSVKAAVKVIFKKKKKKKKWWNTYSFLFFLYPG